MMQRNHTYDVVVIGAGLSGLMAALGARRAGADVAVVAEGGGALELSSGNIDLLAGEWVALAEGHPYRLLGSDGVRQGLDGFLAAARAIGLPYIEDVDQQNQWTVTAVGSLRPTYLPAPGAAVVRPGEAVHVVGFRGLREFHPAVVAEGLRRAMPDTTVTWAWVDLPDWSCDAAAAGATVATYLAPQGGTAPRAAGPAAARAPLHPLQIARLLEVPSYRQQVAARLRDQSVGAPLLLPGVLGLENAATVRADLSAALGVPVAEIPLLAPSLPGLRLGSALTRHVQRAGVDLHKGARAIGATSDRGRVVSITCQTAAGAVEYRAEAFVLATGGLLGGGLGLGARGLDLDTQGSTRPHGQGPERPDEFPDRTLREPIFGLPVDVPAGPPASGDLLSPGGHAFVRAGLRTDQLLRPAGWTNLHICGKMLAGHDPYAEGCGGGVAIATGWRAGLLAGGATR